mgnify:FL=1
MKKTSALSQEDLALKPFIGEVIPWTGAQLIADINPDVLPAFQRLGVPIMCSWYSYMVCDLSMAHFIYHSFISEKLEPVMVTTNLNLNSINMYRTPRLNCSVSLIERNENNILASVEAFSTGGKLVASATGDFRILRLNRY